MENRGWDIGVGEASLGITGVMLYSSIKGGSDKGEYYLSMPVHPFTQIHKHIHTYCQVFNVLS